eukprot:3864796-Prymnesium_polylepis.1
MARARSHGGDGGRGLAQGSGLGGGDGEVSGGVAAATGAKSRGGLRVGAGGGRRWVTAGG